MKKVKEVVGLEPVTTTGTVSSTETDDSYLARQAGLQTVKTSMRGILKSNETTPERKKLLGE